MEPTAETKSKPRGFLPGNPGRPRGARNKTTVLCEKLLAKDAKGVMNVIVNAALEGDLVACKIIADRVAPVVKSTGRMVRFDMPSLRNMGDVSAAHDAILQAVAGGALSIDEGNALSAVVERTGKALYESDLERRLEAVERAQNARIIEGRMV